MERIRSYFTEKVAVSEMSSKDGLDVDGSFWAEGIIKNKGEGKVGKSRQQTNISLLCIKHCPTHWVYSVKKIESDLLEVIA